MDSSIALILAQDGLVTGAVYALLAIGLVLVFSVTRVIFIPQGELVTYGALTIATIQLNGFPKIIYLQMVLGLYLFVLELLKLGKSVHQNIKNSSSNVQFKELIHNKEAEFKALIPSFLQFIFVPGLLWALLYVLQASEVLAQMGVLSQILLTLCLVAPLGSMLFKSVFEPVSDASVLVLLILSVALHLSLMGLGLWMFGAEGGRSKPLLELNLDWGAFSMSGQSIFVIVSSVILMIVFSLYFQYSMSGKALRATAINRLGARLMGINVKTSGQLAFLLAAFLGAFSGILIGPITTIYYDSGFIIGLKGFVGAILGALASYPLAACGALLVGLLESYVSFWASAYKEVWVFSLIIPALMWRSFKHARLLDEDESL